MYIPIFLLILCSMSNSIGISSLETKSLKQLHVLFRHGDRTADPERYPNDPYKNYDYYPFGSGHLINKGKMREYHLGKLLRKWYNDFLGDYYWEQNLAAYTTNEHRIKTSLLLVLASLYPPKGKQIWNNQLNWQAIPYGPPPGKVLTETNDCPNYYKEIERFGNTEEYQKKLKTYEHVLKYISEYAGQETKNFTDVYNLYFTLATESENNLKLPDWARKVFPEPVTEMAIQFYYVTVATKILKQITAGYLLQNVINDANEIIENANNTKIFLYSGHENNIGSLLAALDILDPQIPSYGSALIFEIHGVDDSNFVKIYYHNYTTDTPFEMKLPKCDVICPWTDFQQIVRDLLPTSDTCG